MIYRNLNVFKVKNKEPPRKFFSWAVLCFLNRGRSYDVHIDPPLLCLFYNLLAHLAVSDHSGDLVHATDVKQITAVKFCVVCKDIYLIGDRDDRFLHIPLGGPQRKQSVPQADAVGADKGLRNPELMKGVDREIVQRRGRRPDHMPADDKKLHMLCRRQLRGR